MSQPVKLSDELVLEARTVSAIAERSIAGQIEFWAQLGRAMEPLLRGDQALALKKSGNIRSFSDAISSADSERGRKRVKDYLDTIPFPRFEPSTESAGLLIRIDEDGTRTIGRFVNREFVEAESGDKGKGRNNCAHLLVFLAITCVGFGSNSPL